MNVVSRFTNFFKRVEPNTLLLELLLNDLENFRKSTTTKMLEKLKKEKQGNNEKFDVKN